MHRVAEVVQLGAHQVVRDDAAHGGQRLGELERTVPRPELPRSKVETRAYPLTGGSELSRISK